MLPPPRRTPKTTTLLLQRMPLTYKGHPKNSNACLRRISGPTLTTLSLAFHPSDHATPLTRPTQNGHLLRRSSIPSPVAVVFGITNISSPHPMAVSSPTPVSSPSHLEPMQPFPRHLAVNPSISSHPNTSTSSTLISPLATASQSADTNSPLCLLTVPHDTTGPLA